LVNNNFFRGRLIQQGLGSREREEFVERCLALFGNGDEAIECALREIPPARRDE
jgi:hypothetical protein